MWEVLGGLLLGTAVSGILPLVNAELLVAGVVMAAPEIGIPLVATVSTMGQMATKTALFGLARWAPTRLPRRARAALERAAAAVSARGGAAGSLVLASAVTGLPPFLGVSLAAGALGMRLRSFLVSGAVGRLVRFAVIACAARYLGEDALDMLSAISPTAIAALGGRP
jgi:membrane protein YqaA with SNARE-associated domain